MGARELEVSVSKMGVDEAVADQHLRMLGYQDVRHHPRGQHNPPDFLLDGTIAVEVRRLEAVEQGRDVPKGLNAVSRPFSDRLRKLLLTFSSDEPTTFLLRLQLKRPLPKPWRRVEEEVKKFVRAVLDNAEQAVGMELDIDGKVLLRVIGTSHRNGPTFHIASQTDADLGHWMMEELGRSLRLCISEKTRKVAAQRHLYTEWWLVFVDRLGYALTDEERRREFRRSVSLDSHDWDRIILVNPLEPGQHFEVTGLGGPAG
jgi:hypothetical protein